MSNLLVDSRLRDQQELHPWVTLYGLLVNSGSGDQQDVQRSRLYVEAAAHARAAQEPQRRHRERELDDRTGTEADV